MSSRERWKADKRALKNARTLCNRQRRNMKAYVAIILQARKALKEEDTLRALALVSGNIKYPPDMLDGLDCNHELQHRYVQKCKHCGLIDEDFDDD